MRNEDGEKDKTTEAKELEKETGRKVERKEW